MNAAASTVGPPGNLAIFRFEWTKLRSVRSTPYILIVLFAGTVAVGVGATAATAAGWSSMDPAERASFDPTNLSLTGCALAQLVVGVLGILTMTSEYSGKTIRSTLAAVPHRQRLIANKTAVLLAVTLLVSEAAAFTSFELGQQVLPAEAPHASLADAASLRAVVFAGLYLTCLAALALAIGVAIRHTAGAITTFVLLVIVLPVLGAAFPASYRDRFEMFMPQAIGASSMSAVVPQEHMLQPVTGLLVVCCYAVVLLISGAYLFVRRDV